MRLSGNQLIWIIVTTEMAAVIGLIITPTIQIARQDAWISMLVGGLIGLVLIFLVVHLSTLHPNQTLFQFSQVLLGKWVGKIIVLPYIIAWYVLIAMLLRSFASFVHLILLNKTPVWLIVVLLAILMTYLTYSSGITGIGRYCELLGPIIIVTLIVSFILNLKNMGFHRLLPVYTDSEWINILKGSIAPASWLSGPFFLLVIVAFIQNPPKALSKSMLGVGISVFMVFTATLMTLLVLGPNLAAKLRFSYFMSIRTIEIFNFIQNADIFIMFMWVFGVIAQLSLYFFIVSYEMANWVNVKNWRIMMWISLPIVLILAFLIKDASFQSLFDKVWVSLVFPVCGIGIPILLWIISVIKKKWKQKLGLQ